MKESNTNESVLPRSRMFNDLVTGAERHIRVLIVYIGALGAFFVGTTTLKGPVAEFFGYSSPDEVPGKLLFLVAGLPLLALFVFEVVPSWIRRRHERRLVEEALNGKLIQTGYFRIHPYEGGEQDRRSYVRADRAHERVLAWLQETNESILYLTARSGTGKTSMLNAFVLPELLHASPKILPLVVRSFRDPLDDLRNALLRPGFIWKHPPSDVSDVYQILERACGRLTPGRLLIVFDQFEELLIIHDHSPERLESMKALLASVTERPIPGLRLLLVVRSDYLSKLQETGFPPMRQNVNWKEIGPFTEEASREFLNASGLQIGPRLMDDLICQAIEVEELRGLIRPITLNMVGMTLERSAVSDDRSKRKHKERGALLLGYLRDCINLPDVKEHSSQILNEMITASGNSRPRSVEELSKRTGFGRNAVAGCLLMLGNQGVVRRIDEQEGIWEISHDFVARLLSRILNNWQDVALKKSRLLRAPLCILVWLAIVFFLVDRNSANSETAAKAAVSMAAIKNGDDFVGITVPSDVNVAAALRVIRGMRALEQVDMEDVQLPADSLSHLTKLERLRILRLTNTGIGDKELRHLTALKNLQELYLSGNTGIGDEGLKFLKDMRSLRILHLNGTTISNIGLEHLKGLTNLLDFRASFTQVEESGVVGLCEALRERDQADRDLEDPVQNCLLGGTHQDGCPKTVEINTCLDKRECSKQPKGSRRLNCVANCHQGLACRQIGNWHLKGPVQESPQQ